MNREDDVTAEGQDAQKQRGRSLSRIHLDLSSRITCQLLLPNRCLVYLENSDANSREIHATKSISRFMPRILHIMANYDLDKTWYGATHLIAKFSWGPSTQESNGYKLKQPRI